MDNLGWQRRRRRRRTIREERNEGRKTTDHIRQTHIQTDRYTDRPTHTDRPRAKVCEEKSRVNQRVEERGRVWV